MNLKHLKDILNTYSDSELEDMKVYDKINELIDEINKLKELNK